MTAINIFLTKKNAIVYWDTLATNPLKKGDKKLKPKLYTNKVFVLPQFKSVFAVTGSLQLGLAYFKFLSESFIGMDVDSIKNIELKYFKTFLKENYNLKLFGKIYLIGFSVKEKIIKGFKLEINIDGIFVWNEIQEGLLIKPEVENIETFFLTQENIDNGFVQLMISQKEEDHQKRIEDQVGIGGEILKTNLIISDINQLLIESKMIYKFDDYENLGEEMLNI